MVMRFQRDTVSIIYFKKTILGAGTLVRMFIVVLLGYMWFSEP